MPKRLQKDEASATDIYAKFVAEPFETGYGHTIGNSLRRVLLSSLEGAAITSVKMDGAMHEFTTIDGVVEDVTDLVFLPGQTQAAIADSASDRCSSASQFGSIYKARISVRCPGGASCSWTTPTATTP